jgi:argininosuccinate lyase
MKLWQKDNTEISGLIDSFTVGRDREFDLMLAQFDVEGSVAHVKMLGEVGLMTSEEAQKAVAGLLEIADTIQKGTFDIAEGVEDVHSQVEFLLTEKIGDAGKKIHSGRSRNDQVAVDIKLFLRAGIGDTRQNVLDLFHLLITQSEKFSAHLLPGYTHLQLAMPSSFGLWLGSYAESLVDDMEMLAAAYAVANKNPLGSGAGYGSSFPLSRKRTTELLHFKTLNWNSAYAQMTRGKTEKLTAMALSSIGKTGHGLLSLYEPEFWIHPLSGKPDHRQQHNAT